MPIRCLAFSPDSQLLLTASDDGHMKLCDVPHGSVIATISTHHHTYPIPPSPLSTDTHCTHAFHLFLTHAFSYVSPYSARHAYPVSRLLAGLATAAHGLG